MRRQEFMKPRQGMERYRRDRVMFYVKRHVPVQPPQEGVCLRRPRVSWRSLAPPLAGFSRRRSLLSGSSAAKPLPLGLPPSASMEINQFDEPPGRRYPPLDQRLFGTFFRCPARKVVIKNDRSLKEEFTRFAPNFCHQMVLL